MEFIKNTQMSMQNGSDIIRIDCGPSYYIGTIDINTFPEDFRDNYKEIIQKSFAGYSDDSFSISSNFEHEDLSMNNRYNIKISLKNKFYSFDKNISIPLIFHQKDKVDYLEEKLKFVLEELSSLKAKVEKKHMEIEQESDEESHDIDENSQISDEDSEEEVKHKRKNIIKKKHTSKSQIKKA